MILTYLGYAAIVALGLSHWLQVWKIHKHREVRDIAMGTYILLLCGYVILTFVARDEGSSIFFWRQIATIVPVSVTLCQIWWHRQDHWHDAHDPYCVSCNEELEPDWKFCPYCGNKEKKRKIVGCSEYRMIPNKNR